LWRQAQGIDQVERDLREKVQLNETKAKVAQLRSLAAERVHLQLRLAEANLERQQNSAVTRAAVLVAACAIARGPSWAQIRSKTEMARAVRAHLLAKGGPEGGPASEAPSVRTIRSFLPTPLADLRG
jgi:hypothetical protein